MRTAAHSAADPAAIKAAIDRWIRITGEATTRELANIPILARLSPAGRRHWVMKITKGTDYVREKVPNGGRVLRVTFAKGRPRAARRSSDRSAGGNR